MRALAVAHRMPQSPAGRLHCRQAQFRSRQCRLVCRLFTTSSSSNRGIRSKSRNSWRVLPKALAHCLDPQRQQRPRQPRFRTNGLNRILNISVKPTMDKKSSASGTKAKMARKEWALSRKTLKSTIQKPLVSHTGTKLSIMIKQHIMRRKKVTFRGVDLFHHQKVGSLISTAQWKAFRMVVIMPAAEAPQASLTLRICLLCWAHTKICMLRLTQKVSTVVQGWVGQAQHLFRKCRFPNW